MSEMNFGESTVRDVRVSAPLSQFAQGFAATGFVAEDVASIVPVEFENDLYYRFDRADSLRNIDDTWADGDRAKLIDRGFDKAAYVAEAHGLEVRVTDRQANNADVLLRNAMAKVQWAQRIILMNQEARVAALFATANIAASNKVTLAGVNQFNNGAFAGSIESVVTTGKSAIRTQIGGTNPNTVVIPQAVADVVKADSKIRELRKYTESTLLVNGDLPPTLWNMKVLIPTASHVTSVEGAATVATSDIWGKDMFLLYREEMASTESMTAASIFRVRSWQVEEWREAERAANYYRPSLLQAEKLVSAICAYGIYSAIA